MADTGQKLRSGWLQRLACPHTHPTMRAGRGVTGHPVQRPIHMQKHMALLSRCSPKTHVLDSHLGQSPAAGGRWGGSFLQGPGGGREGSSWRWQWRPAKVRRHSGCGQSSLEAVQDLALHAMLDLAPPQHELQDLVDGVLRVLLQREGRMQEHAPQGHPTTPTSLPTWPQSPGVTLLTGNFPSDPPPLI